MSIDLLSATTLAPASASRPAPSRSTGDANAFGAAIERAAERHRRDQRPTGSTPRSSEQPSTPTRADSTLSKVSDDGVVAESPNEDTDTESTEATPVVGHVPTAAGEASIDAANAAMVLAAPLLDGAPVSPDGAPVEGAIDATGPGSDAGVAAINAAANPADKTTVTSAGATAAGNVVAVVPAVADTTPSESATAPASADPVAPTGSASIVATSALNDTPGTGAETPVGSTPAERGAVVETPAAATLPGDAGNDPSSAAQTSPAHRADRRLDVGGDPDPTAALGPSTGASLSGGAESLPGAADASVASAVPQVNVAHQPTPRAEATGAASTLREVHAQLEARLAEEGPNGVKILGAARLLRGGPGAPSALTINLDPAALGKIRVELSMHEGQVAVNLMAEKAQAVQAIGNQMSQLRDALEAEGLHLSNLGVDLSNQRHQPGSDRAADGGAAHAMNSPASRGHSDSASADSSPKAAPSRTVDADALVDVDL